MRTNLTSLHSLCGVTGDHLDQLQGYNLDTSLAEVNILINDVFIFMSLNAVLSG